MRLMRRIELSELLLCLHSIELLLGRPVAALAPSCRIRAPPPRLTVYSSWMITILPEGLVSLAEAAHVVESALSGGKPDQPVVIGLREVLGHDVGDGRASSEAKTAIWKAVDSKVLQVVAVGGRSERVIALTREFTLSIPFLRRVFSFVYLRPTHRQWKTVARWFGPDVASVVLAVRTTELKKLAQRLMRDRRHKRSSKPGTKYGRPSNQEAIQKAITFVVDRKQWTTVRSLKELTLLVNRSRAVAMSVSRNSVTRALDALFEATKDRRYARIRRGELD